MRVEQEKREKPQGKRSAFQELVWALAAIRRVTERFVGKELLA